MFSPLPRDDSRMLRAKSGCACLHNCNSSIQETKAGEITEESTEGIAFLGILRKPYESVGFSINLDRNASCYWSNQHFDFSLMYFQFIKHNEGDLKWRMSELF